MQRDFHLYNVTSAAKHFQQFLGSRMAVTKTNK